MNSKKSSNNNFTEISTVFGITLLLVLLGVFAYFMLSANEKAKDIKEQLSVDVLFHDGVSIAEVLQIEKALSIKPYVKRAQFISKDSAKALMMKHVGKDAFDILDGANPIPPSIHVNLSSDYVNPDSAALFSSRLLEGNEHLISEVSYSEAQFLEVGTVFKNFELILLIIAGILLFISVILINITIRLAVYSKRFVIRTMQLVGAKSSFIRRPFLFKAIFNGFVSGTLAIIVLIVLWKIFSNFNPNIVVQMSSSEEILHVQLFNFALIFSGILFAGITISWFSTLFALNKYIWVKSEKLY
jgi:cell division transport system permease protein